MNTLVVYDSQFGNTEKIAQQIAMTLATYGPTHAARVTDVPKSQLGGIDLLIIGCPTQAWNSTKIVQQFIAGLERKSSEHLFVAAFDTRIDQPDWLTGSAARSMGKQLRQREARIVLPPESFLVQATEGPLVAGEMERAVEWATSLHDAFVAQTEPVVVPM